MEYMATVRDGSEKGEGRGYWTLEVIGTEVSNPRVIPLYGRLYSHRAPDYQSENVEIERAIRVVSEATEKRGIWVLDRGGGRRQLFNYLLERKLQFVVRLMGERHLESEGGKSSAVELAQDCPTLFWEYIVKEETKQERPLRLEVGYRKVRLPGRRELLTLVVVRGLGHEPLMLLTSLAVKRSRKSVWHVVAAYFSRWRVEETIRFLKQSYQLEDIRILSYGRLQSMMAVAYFTSAYLGLKLRLRVLMRHMLRAARRVFGVPDFRLYALADGIKHFLFSRSKALRLDLPPPKPRFVQGLLFDL